MYLVGLCGLAGHGKSTVAGLLRAIAAERGVSASTIAFSDPLKDALAALFSADRSAFEYSEAKRCAVCSFSGTTIRESMQWLGGAVRDKFGADAIVSLSMEKLRRLPGGENDLVVFHDVRMPVEVEKIREMGGTVYLVDARKRLGAGENRSIGAKEAKDVTETAVGSISFGPGEVIENNGGKADLETRLRALADEIFHGSLTVLTPEA